MAALVFPAAPAVGDLYPVNPGTSGVSQWEWDGVKWVTVPTSVTLGTANQGAFNAYQWPAADGTSAQQLTTDGAGNLSWAVTATGSSQPLGLSQVFDGTSTTYTLVELGTPTFFTPNPSTNIIVFLGGVAQTPTVSYSVTGNQITFSTAPAVGTDFYAVSNVVL